MSQARYVVRAEPPAREGRPHPRHRRIDVPLHQPRRQPQHPHPVQPPELRGAPRIPRPRLRARVNRAVDLDDEPMRSD